MTSFRENPESEANQAATKQHERDVFAARMQVAPRCSECGGRMSQIELLDGWSAPKYNGFACEDCGRREE